MKLLIVIPGFGPAQVDFKKTLLQNNLSHIRSTFFGDIDIKLFNYGTEKSGVDCDEIMEKGVVGQYIYKHITPDIVDKYDYIILMLDDIELSDNINIEQMIRNYNYYNIDILSPSLHKSSKFSHSYMLQRDTGMMRITQCLEFFFYLMKPSSYRKWYTQLDENSCWLWGIDYAMYHYNIKPVLMDTMTIVHHIKGGSYSSNLPSAYTELENNRKRLRLQSQIAEYEYIEMI